MDEMERKTTTKMAGHTQGVCERSHHQQHETIRQRQGGMERSCHDCRLGSDSTRRHKVKVIQFFVIMISLNISLFYFVHTLPSTII